MRLFTENDITGRVRGYPRIYASYTDLLHCPLVWQKHGLQQTASGYGQKLTTEHKISFCDKLYRLYCTQYGNAGSVWFTAKGEKIHVS